MTHTHNFGSVGMSPLDCFHRTMLSLGLKPTRRTEEVRLSGDRYRKTSAIVVGIGPNTAELTEAAGRFFLKRGGSTVPVDTGDGRLTYRQVVANLFPSVRRKEVAA